MSEQIYTFTEEEIAAMFKSGRMKLLIEPADDAQKMVSPEQRLGRDLIQEWEKQAKKLADLFAEELNQSKDQYIESLPKFFSQPESYKGRFDTPLIVQTPTKKLTRAKILEIAGVVNYLDLMHVKDWQKDPGKFKTPKASYVTWLDDGSRNTDISVADVRKSLAADERGGTLLDGVALLIQNPDILKNHCFGLPGSQHGSDSAPYLGGWGGKLELAYSFIVGFHSWYGSVVAGRNIGI